MHRAGQRNLRQTKKGQVNILTLMKRAVKEEISLTKEMIENFAYGSDLPKLHHRLASLKSLQKALNVKW
jgi:hypothetical protein